MKQHHVCSLALLLALLILLCACTKPAEPVTALPLPDTQPGEAVQTAAPTVPVDTTQKEIEDEVYHLSYETLPLPGGVVRATALTIVGDKLIVGGLAESGTALAWTTLDGETKQLELPTSAEYLYAACPADGGGFWLLYGSLPAAYTDANGAAILNEQAEGRLGIAGYDKNLNLQYGLFLQNAYTGGTQRFTQLLKTDDGFMLLSASLLARVDMQGAELAQLEFDFKNDGWMAACMQQTGGALYVLAAARFSGSSDELWQLDAETLEQLDSTILADEDMYGLGLHPDGRLLLSGENAISAYDPATGEKETLFSLAELGIQIPATQIFPLAEGYLFFGPGDQELTFLLWQPGAQPERTLLQMAVVGKMYSWSLSEMVRTYNLSQSRYQIEYTTYAETPNDGDATYDALRTQIIAGDAPDLFCFCNDGLAAAAPLAAEDMCTDLLPLLDADETLTRGSILPFLLNALTQDGTLYELPLTFAVDTFVAPSRLIPEPGVTVAELETARQNAGSGYLPIESWNTPGNLLALSVPFYMGQYADKASASCNFQTQEFYDYLAWCKTWGGDGSIPPEPERAILRNTQIRSLQFLAGVSERAEQSWFDEPGYTYAGVPNETNCGSSFCLTCSIGISPQCRDIDGAWEFLRFAFAYAGEQTEDIPAGVEALHTQMDAYIAGEMTDWRGEPTVISQADADQFYALLDVVTVRKGSDEALKQIIQDEAAAYFDGACTAEQAAEKIQSRASLYLMEQYG